MANRRRLLRFSLRALLVLMTLACLWLGMLSVDAHRQKAAVEWVLKNGGTVGYDLVRDPRRPGYARQEHSQAPAWLRGFIGDDYFRTATFVSLANSELDDIHPLAGLPNLETLSLEVNYITDIMPLAKLTKLKLLNLRNNQISDLAPLEKLASLETLNIDRNDVKNIAVLSSFPELGHFSANNNQISDLAPLANLKKLRWLELKSNNISDISVLSSLPNLRAATVYGNPIDIQQLPAFRYVVQ